jgi:hypothetical protein
MKTLIDILSYSYKSLIYHHDSDDLYKIKKFIGGNEENVIDTIDLMMISIKNLLDKNIK